MKDPLRVKIVTPDEVLQMDDAERKSADAFALCLNETLQKQFDGWTLVVSYPKHFRPAVVYQVVQACRSAGWGCTADIYGREITFWKAKQKKVQMEEAEEPKEEGE